MLLLVAITIFFAACAKDEPEDNNSLIGVWEYKMEAWNNHNGKYVTVIHTVTFTFNSDGSYSRVLVGKEDDIVRAQNTIAGTYSIDKDTIITHTTFDDYYENPNVDVHYSFTFKMDRDNKGKYITINIDEARYYKQ